MTNKEKIEGKIRTHKYITEHWDDPPEDVAMVLGIKVSHVYYVKHILKKESQPQYYQNENKCLITGFPLHETING